MAAGANCDPRAAQNVPVVHASADADGVGRRGKGVGRVEPSRWLSTWQAYVAAVKQPERRALLLSRLRVLPKTLVPSWARAALGMATPRNAIRAKCQECVGYVHYKRRIGGCDAYACPLWSYRPYQNAACE